MAPQNIRAEAKSKTELLITWEPPPTDACNGILLGYHVGYLPAEDAEKISPSTPPYSRYTVKTININSQYGEDVIINSLTAFTTYSIVVQAFNSKGPGPFSKPITVQTDEGSMCAIMETIFRVQSHPGGGTCVTYSYLRENPYNFFSI